MITYSGNLQSKLQSSEDINLILGRLFYLKRWYDPNIFNDYARKRKMDSSPFVIMKNINSSSKFSRGCEHFLMLM